MKKIMYLTAVSLIFFSCKSEKPVEDDKLNKEIEVVNDSLSDDVQKNLQKPEVINEPIVKDTIPTHVFKSGETLWYLCRTYYGNRHYSSILSIYNEIENVNDIKNGTILKVPSMHNLLKDPKLKLDPIIRVEIEKVLEAREKFMKHEKTLGESRKNVEGRAPIKLSQNTKVDLQSAIDLIDESISTLAEVKSDSINAPIKMIGQLKSLSANLTNLSKGNHDGPYQYDLDMVHQRLVHAIRNAITWAQNNYQ
ncbi:hypothetical protein [Aquimarina algiphila]|uniref:hypothetical protein n=1 Tax=Aquimarina algiphila TaxID=2047982 RepID=UPI00232CC385|nr:hypothetical protein [Aquimarina algiphila]